MKEGRNPLTYRAEGNGNKVKQKGKEEKKEKKAEGFAVM